MSAADLLRDVNAQDAALRKELHIAREVLRILKRPMDPEGDHDWDATGPVNVYFAVGAARQCIQQLVVYLESLP